MEPLVEAVRAGHKLVVIGDSAYAFAPYYGLGWWLWKLDSHSSPEYFIDRAVTYCTCPAVSPCKHLKVFKERIHVVHLEGTDNVLT
jgi:hypothetical protein